MPGAGPARRRWPRAPARPARPRALAGDADLEAPLLHGSSPSRLAPAGRARRRPGPAPTGTAASASTKLLLTSSLPRAQARATRPRSLSDAAGGLPPRRTTRRRGDPRRTWPQPRSSAAAPAPGQAPGSSSQVSAPSRRGAGQVGELRPRSPRGGPGARRRARVRPARRPPLPAGPGASHPPPRPGRSSSAASAAASRSAPASARRSSSGAAPPPRRIVQARGGYLVDLVSQHVGLAVRRVCSSPPSSARTAVEPRSRYGTHDSCTGPGRCSPNVSRTPRCEGGP